MKILVIGSQVPHVGGAHDVENSLIKLVNEVAKNIDGVEIINQAEYNDIRTRVKTNLDLALMNLFKCRHSIIRGKIVKKFFPNYRSFFERRISKAGIGYVLFLGTFEKALLLKSIPYCVTVWDIGFRNFPQFPEYASGNVFEQRQDLYTQVLPKAHRILTSSEMLSAEIAYYFNIKAASFITINFFKDEAFLNLISSRFELNDKYDASVVKDLEDFVLYPANFWKHKNHRILFEAMSELINSKRSCRKLILTGTDHGYLSSVVGLIRKLNLEDHVINLGRVDLVTLAQLIKKAAWVAMPSILGPTNLPPLESLLSGTPCAVTLHCSEQFPEWSFLRVLDGTLNKDWLLLFDSLMTPPEVEKSLVLEFNANNKEDALSKFENFFGELKSESVFLTP